MSGIFISITFIKCRDFSYWQAAPRLISPHHRHNLLVLSPRNILERILNLIHPHREKVDVHPASDDVIFRDAQCLIPLLPISLSFRSHPSGIVFVVVFSIGLLAPTFLWHHLSNGLADLHLSCLSYNPVYFGHGHPHRTHSQLLPQILLHLGHHQ